MDMEDLHYKPYLKHNFNFNACLKKKKPLKDHQNIALKEIWHIHSNTSETPSMTTTRLRFIRSYI